MLEYQEPGVIYAVGRPVALTRDRDDGFFARLREWPIRPDRPAVERDRRDACEVISDIEVRPVDEVEGFDPHQGEAPDPPPPSGSCAGRLTIRPEASTASALSTAKRRHPCKTSLVEPGKLVQVIVSWRNWSAKRRRPARPIAARRGGSAARLEESLGAAPVEVARFEEDARFGEHDLARFASMSLADRRSGRRSSGGKDARRSPSRRLGWITASTAFKQFEDAIGQAPIPLRMNDSPDAQPIEVGDQAGRGGSPSPIQTKRTFGFEERTSRAMATMSSWPFNSKRRATVAKATSSSARSSSRRTSGRRAAEPGTRPRPCHCRPSGRLRGDRLCRPGAWFVIASQTLTIAWHRRAAQRSSAT